MPWHAVTLPNLVAAMAQCDHVGVDEFRTMYGPFHPARNLRMSYPGRRGNYEARPLLAAAYAHLAPRAGSLTPRNFRNNDAHEFLERLGFRRVKL